MRETESADRPDVSAERVMSFGPFRVFPAQQLLLEGETPIRLGSRAFAILTALLERPGELVGKSELIGRVWPDTLVDESSLRVHVAGLRRALGDGQPGRRFLTNIPGRGYQFVGQLDYSEPPQPPVAREAAKDGTHNLPISQSRVIGRAGVIDTLGGQLPKHRIVTLVGAGGIGKTAVALALAEALLPAYADGIRFVNLGRVGDPQFVAGALGNALDVNLNAETAAARLVDFLADKQMLIVLDSCEHVIEATTLLAEQLLNGASGIHILATSREPLRARGERVHRLASLEYPPAASRLAAGDALAFPAVQLFVERASAVVDRFDLTDRDAPLVAGICRKLGGIPLAIELAAARVDAFSIEQLAELLDHRIGLLNQGRRTAEPRHRSMAATLDWSYQYLPEDERAVLRRLAVFAGGFTLSSVVAVAGTDDIDVVEALANLVAKSLISADLGGVSVHYRLLDTTRAYALQKLTEHGETGEYARRHALHHLDWFRNAQTDWQAKSKAELRSDYGRRIDDVRAAVDWALSPAGDVSVGAQLMAASAPLWLELTLLHECRERMETALERLSLQPSLARSDELRLRAWMGLIIPYTVRPLPETSTFWSETHALAEELGELGVQPQTLAYWAGYCMYAGRFREAVDVAERCAATAIRSEDTYLQTVSHMMFSDALYALGHLPDALRHAETVVGQSFPSTQRAMFANRTTTRAGLSNTLWLMGFPDRAMASAQVVLEEGLSMENDMALATSLVKAVCPIALQVGDLAAAERSIEMLLERSARSLLDNRYQIGRCLKGALLLAQGDFGGLTLMREGLTWLREARFNYNYAPLMGMLAEGLASAGLIAEARAVVDEVVDLAEQNEELSCLPELLRIKAEIIRLEPFTDVDAMAEAHFQRALEMARQQKALSWELRVAMSLAGLWRQRSRTADGIALVSAVYRRFTEGFDTADLKRARALIGATA